MVHKSLNGIAHVYLQNLFTRRSQCLDRVIRHSQEKLYLLRKQTVTGQKRFSYRGVNSWNSLIIESKQSCSLSYCILKEF